MATYTLYAKVVSEAQAGTVLFLPGFTGSHESWDEDFRALGERFRLVMVDTLGFGHSPKPEIDYSVDDHLEAVRHTLRQLQVTKSHLVGQAAQQSVEMGSIIVQFTPDGRRYA